MSKGAEVAKIVDEGLDAMPGVSSSTTVMPTPDLTPREVSAMATHALSVQVHMGKLYGTVMVSHAMCLYCGLAIDQKVAWYYCSMTYW